MRTERTIKQLEYAKQFHRLNGLVVKAIDDAIICLKLCEAEKNIRYCPLCKQVMEQSDKEVAE